MSNDKEKFGVALTKEACPICGKLFDGPLVMNSRLTTSDAKKVKELHGQTIGYMDKPCPECQEMQKVGVVCIGVIMEKTDDMKNPYRSGEIIVLRDEFFKRNVDDEQQLQQILHKRATFMDQQQIDHIRQQQAGIEG